MEQKPGLNRMLLKIDRSHFERFHRESILRRTAMGEIRAKIGLQNYEDKLLFEMGKLAKKKVRSRDIDAVVDTGAVMMLLPQDLVEDLGLKITGRTLVLLANDARIELPCTGLVHLTIAGREWETDCLVGPPGCEPLIGQLIMARLDLIPDPVQRTLTVRPESPLRPTRKMKTGRLGKYAPS